MQILKKLAACTAVSVAAGAFAGGTPKALMIMVDGMRADAVENMRLPALQALREGRWQPGYSGFSTLTAQTISNARPSSAANHATIATGVTAEKTKVYKNGDTPKGDFARWPSWMARVADARPGTKALYAYSWSGDVKLAPHPKVVNLPITSVVSNNWPVTGGYAASARTTPEIMSRADAPDATLYFIDIGDWGGHRSGFYPYGGEYLLDIQLADRIIGETLDAIASRPSFKDEDWLVMVTSDHGGYGKSHGIWGGHATTIPVIVAGRHVPQGRIAGMPRNCDLAPLALAHFGLDVGKMDLDGRAPRIRAADPARPLREGLAAYFPFDDASPANGAGGAVAAKLHGKTVSGMRGGRFGGCLLVASGTDDACGASLAGSEKLDFEGGACFAMSLWVRMDGPQAMQAPIVSNKDWASGANPGFILIGARKTDAVKTPGVCFNCALEGVSKRLDMGTFDIDYGLWTFYGVTCGEDGVLTVYQGGKDGRLYWIAGDASAIKLKTGLPFWIGQDGTGACKVSFKGAVDDFALWTRALSRAEVRRIYEAGCAGRALGDLKD